MRMPGKTRGSHKEGKLNFLLLARVLYQYLLGVIGLPPPLNLGNVNRLKMGQGEEVEGHLRTIFLEERAS